MSDELLDENLGEHAKNRKVFNPRPAIVWGIIFLLGYLFKIQHYPGATVFFVSGSGGLCGYAFSSIVKFKGKNIQSNILGIFCLAWMARLIYGILKEGGQPINLTGFMFFLAVLMLSSVFHLILKNRRA